MKITVHIEGVEEAKALIPLLAERVHRGELTMEQAKARVKDLIKVRSEKL